MSFKWSLTLERPSCSWAASAAALRKGQLVTQQKPPMLIPKGKPCGGRATVVACCAEESGLLGTPQQSLVVVKLEISKEYPGFCFACNDSRPSTTAAGRAADWRHRHTGARRSLLAEPSPKVTTNLVLQGSLQRLGTA